MKPTRIASMLILFSSVALPLSRGDTRQTKSAFTVADDIEITQFWTIGFLERMVRFSPDGRYLVVYAERGRVNLNRVEDSLRFYRTEDIDNFLARANASRPPSPVWRVTCSGREGPVINDWRWLPDSSGVAFLETSSRLGNKQLVLADLRKRIVETLTSANQWIRAFGVRDRRHYVYTMPDPESRQLSKADTALIVGTGRALPDLILSDDRARLRRAAESANAYLWAVVDGKRFKVRHDGAPLVPFNADIVSGLSLSPDGYSVVAILPVLHVPPSWPELYPPPKSSEIFRIGAGPNSAKRFVRINLLTGGIQDLTGGPTASSAGWESGYLSSPSWSSDGQAVLLPATFLQAKDQAPTVPCVAFIDLLSDASRCVETLTARNETGTPEEGSHFVKDAWFINGDKHRIMVRFSRPPGHSVGNTEYQRIEGGVWRVVRHTRGEPQNGPNGLEIKIDEGIDRPPLLVARRKNRSRVIWDPNPHLKAVDLGRVSLYKWRDPELHEWAGLLYMPSRFTAAKRYPLVIQTHGFSETHFDPSGYYPPANAARELAALGIAVLQVGDDACATSNRYEGPCAVSAYEAAAKQLVSDGLVDPDKIGIVGFSRTCYYVMQTLTTSALHFKAASVTDGTVVDYWQYLLHPDLWSENFTSVIGAEPFGDGLQDWLTRSPGFNLDKVTTPLLVVAEGLDSLLYMWSSYSGLRCLHKPVDLTILNTDEHVVTNPAVRMASQSQTVDWFRFWLKGEEDPSPAKMEQYKRWRHLRSLQKEDRM